MSQSSGIPLEHLFACPKCGGRAFNRIQYGYVQIIPCELMHSGKKAVCHYEDEELDEEDDGQKWRREIRCADPTCGYELTEEDLGHSVEDIDCDSVVDVGPRMIAEHGKQKR